MEKIKTFKELIVWQKAHQFVLNIYKITESFPKYEMYGLISQLRRAAVVIAVNIAEGYKECRYYIILAYDLKYTANKNLNNDLNEIAKLLSAYAKAIISNYKLLTPNS